MHSPRPGLISWLISILLLMILVLFPLTQPLEPDRNYFRIERLDRFNKTDIKQEKKLKIIALGSSMTRAAFYFDEEMERFSRENGNQYIQFIRMTRALTTIEGFRSFYKDILAAGPDLLIIETNSNNFILKLPDLAPLSRFNLRIRLYYLKVLQYYGLDFLIPANNQNTLDFDQEAEVRGKYAPIDHKYDKYAQKAKSIKINPAPFTVEDIEFFQKIQTAGARVILLEVPRSDRAQSLLDSTFLSTVRKKNIDLAEKHHLHFWSVQDAPDLSYYSDMAHLNAKGRDLFCGWFIGKIDSLYHEGGRR